MAYPGVALVLALTIASCSDSQVLIYTRRDSGQIQHIELRITFNGPQVARYSYQCALGTSPH